MWYMLYIPHTTPFQLYFNSALKEHRSHRPQVLDLENRVEEPPSPSLFLRLRIRIRSSDLRSSSSPLLLLHQLQELGLV